MIDTDRPLRDYRSREQILEDKKSKRTTDIQGLVYGIVGRYAEFFAVPENRLDFIKDQSAKDFFRMSQFVNAKVRGEKPHELRKKPEERLGGALPTLHTPKTSDKLPAFSRGFDAIQEYLENTDDSPQKQIEGVAMAIEALIIWVHPFINGNGRTSRFMAKLIEGGAVDLDELADETVSSKHRQMEYLHKLTSRESILVDANNEELMLDDDERDALRKKAEDLPNDVEATYLSVKRLLEDDAVRQSVLQRADAHKARTRQREVA